MSGLPALILVLLGSGIVLTRRRPRTIDQLSRRLVVLLIANLMTWFGFVLFLHRAILNGSSLSFALALLGTALCTHQVASSIRCVAVMHRLITDIRIRAQRGDWIDQAEWTLLEAFS